MRVCVCEREKNSWTEEALQVLQTLVLARDLILWVIDCTGRITVCEVSIIRNLKYMVFSLGDQVNLKRENNLDTKI